MTVSPHNDNSTTLGLAATLQVAAMIPNCLITEYLVNCEARAHEVMITPLQVDNGYIALPTGPGLGVE